MPDTELREARVDLAAFILCALEKGGEGCMNPDGTRFCIPMDERDIFATVGHDVNGLIRRLQPVNPDEFFVPRSAGYSKEFKPGAKEAPPF